MEMKLVLSLDALMFLANQGTPVWFQYGHDSVDGSFGEYQIAEVVNILNLTGAVCLRSSAEGMETDDYLDDLKSKLEPFTTSRNGPSFEVYVMVDDENGISVMVVLCTSQHAQMWRDVALAQAKANDVDQPDLTDKGDDKDEE